MINYQLGDLLEVRVQNKIQVMKLKGCFGYSNNPCDETGYILIDEKGQEFWFDYKDVSIIKVLKSNG